ncbi:MAG: hypothetical protein NT007_18340 [Candidatus Kapabacteria bacterium]|nr:hypothetical protein [Candidatus Kapabacteria bacterium]
MLKLIAYLTILIAFASSAIARPQYSILQSYGIKCTGCHISINGGAARNAQGNIARNAISLIPTDKVPVLGTIFDKISNNNSFFDDKVMWGMDFRYLSARFPTPDSNLTAMSRQQRFMQWSPYLIITPTDGLQFDGMYNIATQIDPTFKGQQSWTATATLNLNKMIDYDNWLPMLRIGKFQPGIGIRWDDHTVLSRWVNGTKAQVRGKNGEDYYTKMPLYPPDDYAEYGAELSFDKYDWLQLAFGAFKSTNLLHMPPAFNKNYSPDTLGKDSISFTGKMLVILPEWHGISSFVGGTFLKNGELILSDAFLSFGMRDKFVVIAEFSYSDKKDLMHTQAYLLEADYQFKDYFIPFARIERSQSREIVAPAPYYRNLYNFGAHLNLLPFIELIPQYQISRYEHISGYASQWLLQLHVFY